LKTEKKGIQKATIMTEKLIIRIVGILITDRKKAAVKVRETLTPYGCSIKTRLGLISPYPESTCS